MRYRLALLAAAFLGIHGTLPAQPAAPPPGEIDRLVRDLDHEQYARRARATRELLKLEGAALVPLKKALEQAPTLELACRARELLRKLAIHEPGGEAVGGLRLRLTASRDAARAGDEVTLTTSLANLTERPLNVQVGFTTCGNYLECGSALRRLAGGTDEGPAWRALFCGTGAGPMFVTVPPRSVVEYRTAARLLTQKDGKAALVLGGSGYAAFPVEAAGPAAFRVTLTQAPGTRAENSDRRGGGVPPSDLQAPYWAGSAASNTVQIKLAP